MNTRTPSTRGANSPVYIRRLREAKAIVKEWTVFMDGALHTYRRSQELPHPPRRLTFLTEQKQIQLLIWRSWFVRFGYPMQDLLYHGIRGLVPGDLQHRLLARQGDLLGVGVPFRVFVSERPLDYISAKLIPVSPTQRRIEVSGHLKLSVPDMYTNKVKKKDLEIMRIQTTSAHEMEKELRRYKIPVDVFVK
jgi:hypothetical protein